MSRKPRLFLAIFIGLLMISVAGCVTVGRQDEIPVVSVPAQLPSRIGIYHKVKAGETLWRIAQTYGIALNEVILANNIPKAAKIEKNQLIFIPGATAPKDIVIDLEKETSEFEWPIHGKVMRYFHDRYDEGVNRGIDIRGQAGDMVKASRTGRVVFADYLNGYGHTVILDHMDGLYSVYARNSRLFVRLDEVVLKRKDIAQLGGSGDLAYLHFEIRKNSIEDNPLFYLP